MCLYLRCLSLPRRCLFSKGYILTFVSRCRAPAAKWTEKQLPAHGKGIRSGAKSDRYHLPNLQFNNRPGQYHALIWLLYLTASKSPLRIHNNAKKGLLVIVALLFSFCWIIQFIHTAMIRNIWTCPNCSRSQQKGRFWPIPDTEDSKLLYISNPAKMVLYSLFLRQDHIILLPSGNTHLSSFIFPFVLRVVLSSLVLTQFFKAFSIS